MSKGAYQICTHCIMDTTDPEITFDSNGVCSHCRNFDKHHKEKWYPNEEGRKQLASIVDQIKSEGIGKRYDCIIGLSGGADSSYLAYQTKKFGLRPLAVHVDGGWNREVAVKNIEDLVKALGFDLYTYVVDWEEMKDLQLAFLRAGVANQDTPQDHAFFAALYGFAVQNGIKYVLSGSNIATESVLPKAWGYDSMDSRHLRAIHKRFGQRKLRNFPTVSFFQYHFLFPYIKRMRVVKLLNYMVYNKTDAIRVLEKDLGWRNYGGKHHESRFTRFFQGYYLPRKFGYDKRRAHLSSLILAGQMTREEALEKMKIEAYPKDEVMEDKEFVIKKLGLEEEGFEKLLALPNRSFADYPSNYRLRKNVMKIQRVLKVLGLNRVIRRVLYPVTQNSYKD